MDTNRKKLLVKRTIRQSQLISPWSVGQMINFPQDDESLMVAGLDAWVNSYNQALDGMDEFIVRESRLQKRLNVDHFRLPPDYRDSGKGIRNPQLTIPFVRFPRWHYCYRCGSMEFLSIYQTKNQRCKGIKFDEYRSCTTLPERNRPFLMPIRFVAICQNGHIEDFPFMQWVHRKKPNTSTCSLRYLIRNSSTALGAIRLVCSCGEEATMSRSFDKDALDKIGKRCNGQRPWIGEVGDQARGCNEALQTVQRGASNVYFPDVRSSIYIPGDEETDEEIESVLERFWDLLTSGIVEGQQLDKDRFKILARDKNLDLDTLYAAALRKLESLQSKHDDEEESEEVYRKFEFDALHKLVDEKKKDFLVKTKNVDEYGRFIKKYITNVSLAYKLRETRALVGFSRLLPENTKSLKEEKADLFLGNVNWLPAIIVRGEGIFLELNDGLLKAWEARPDVSERSKNLIDNYNTLRLGYRLPERILNPRFILLHTFAHILISQLSLQCGYGSSSLRERIYCNTENSELTMNGILLYTASGDSEGSMGGLVKQGEPGRLEEIITTGLHESKWCSSDPVCIESKGQGPGSCNLAACHNCAILPETSCEEGNRLLDRALLIGTIAQPELAFFSNNTR